eukprot:GHUV01052811.1.p1 GENE.GHUV01052811.1~~GHUV01052811.1.p1  ORF type:complete len:137 (+),score=17.69 GHUV01052811.1:224-634(+)
MHSYFCRLVNTSITNAIQLWEPGLVSAAAHNAQLRKSACTIWCISHFLLMLVLPTDAAAQRHNSLLPPSTCKLCSIQCNATHSCPLLPPTVASLILSGTTLRIRLRARMTASTATTPAATRQPAKAFSMLTWRPKT